MLTFGLTTAGLAELNAHPGVPPVLTVAKFGDGYGYVPSAGDTDIHGAEVFQNAPSAAQVLNTNTLVYSIYLDADVGPFNYGEVGLFLPGNVLFALGVSSLLEAKIANTPLTPGNTVRIDCYVSTVGSNHNVYAAVVNDSDVKLNAVGSVDALPSASGVEPNIFIVPHPAHPAQSLVATANNGAWTLEGYNQPAGEGTVTLVSPLTFNITYSSSPLGAPPLLAYPGYLLMQFTAGPAVGCIRKVTNITTNQVHIASPFFIAPNAGDPFLLYAANSTTAPIVPPPAPGGLPTESFAVPGPLAPWGSNCTVIQLGTGATTSAFGMTPFGAIMTTNLYFDGTTVRYVADGQGQITMHWAGTQQTYFVNPGLADEDAMPNMIPVMVVSQSGQINANAYVDDSVGGQRLGWLGTPESLTQLGTGTGDLLIDKSFNGLAICHDPGDNNPRTYTLDSNATQNWADGTTIVIENLYGAGDITITSVDPIQMVGAAGLTGNRILLSGGRAELRWRQIGQMWRISGSPELT